MIITLNYWLREIKTKLPDRISQNHWKSFKKITCNSSFPENCTE